MFFLFAFSTFWFWFVFQLLSLIVGFFYFCERLTPKNDERTKRTSTKPTLSSEIEIEKWHLTQLAKTLPFFKTVVNKTVFLFLDGCGREGRVDSCLDPALIY